jgi:hypothetical protein
LQLGTLAAAALANSTFSRPIGIIHRKGRKLYANTEAFIDSLKHGTAANGRHYNGSTLSSNGRLTKPGRRTKV